MKCSKCGTEFEEGVFCPECGMKCEDTLQRFDSEVKKEKEETERLAKEKEVERLAKEREEARLAKEKIETERLLQENLKRDMDIRTVRGTVYKTLDEAELAKQEHNKIDLLKTQLLDTKSQKKRQEIFNNFTEKITIVDVRNRYEMLKEKISRKTPISETINRVYGITVFLAFLVAIIGAILVGVDTSIFLMICVVWAGFGVWIWLLWKIILFIKSMGENYYKNIKNI